MATKRLPRPRHAGEPTYWLAPAIRGVRDVGVTSGVSPETDRKLTRIFKALRGNSGLGVPAPTMMSTMSTP